MTSNDQVRIFDTTLRDGEQCDRKPVVDTTGTIASSHPQPLKGGLARRYALLGAETAMTGGQS